MRFRRILTATSSGVSSFLVRVSVRLPAWGNTRGADAREHAGAGERGRSADGYWPIVPDPSPCPEHPTNLGTPMPPVLRVYPAHRPRMRAQVADVRGLSWRAGPPPARRPRKPSRAHRQG